MRRLSKVQQFSWIKIYFKNTQWSSCNRFLLLLHAVNISISMILPFSWLTWLVLEGRVCAVSWVYAISWLCNNTPTMEQYMHLFSSNNSIILNLMFQSLYFETCALRSLFLSLSFYPSSVCRIHSQLLMTDGKFTIVQHQP